MFKKSKPVPRPAQKYSRMLETGHIGKIEPKLRLGRFNNNDRGASKEEYTPFMPNTECNVIYNGRYTIYLKKGRIEEADSLVWENQFPVIGLF